MSYILANNGMYIGIDNSSGRATSYTSKSKAIIFDTEKKAQNFKANLKATMKRFDWNIVELTAPDEEIEDDFDELDLDKEDFDAFVCDENFDVLEFVKNTIQTTSQLKHYIKYMKLLEHQRNLMIKDIRHYKRDERTRLNAIQLKNLAQYETILEKERYKYKSNHLIAELYLDNLSNLDDQSLIERAEFIKNSEYKPRILTYEMIDEIIGKTRC